MSFVVWLAPGAYINKRQANVSQARPAWGLAWLGLTWLEKNGPNDLTCFYTGTKRAGGKLWKEPSSSWLQMKMKMGWRGSGMELTWVDFDLAFRVGNEKLLTSKDEKKGKGWIWGANNDLEFETDKKLEGVGVKRRQGKKENWSKNKFNVMYCSLFT